jgi:alpha-beta hydrolase superfamily lysophospholipase
MQLEHNIKQPVGQRQPRPLLLVHGAWHAAWCYDLWVESFAALGYETHTFSMPAHGKSAAVPHINLLGLKDYVSALTEIIDAIQPTPYVVAHSLGGFVLQHYLQAHTLPAAVLLCTLPYFGAVPFYLRYFRRHPLRYLAAALTGNLRMMVNQSSLVREYLISDDAALSAEQLVSRFDQESLRVAIECMLPIRRVSHKTPLMVIAAQQDGIFTIDEQKRVAQKYGSELLIFPDQNHDLMIERSREQVADSIHRWLQGQQASTTSVA